MHESQPRNAIRVLNSRFWFMAALLALPLATSCTSVNSRLADRERELGTHRTGKWVYHRLADDPQGLGFKFPGYLVVLEKTLGTEIGAPRSYDCKNPSPAPESLHFEQLLELDCRYINHLLNDRRRAFVSEVVQFRAEEGGLVHIKNTALHSVYVPPEINTKDVYSRGFVALEALRKNLGEELSKGDYTHVLLLSMGWNTDQQESMRNFNSLVGNLLVAAEEGQTGSKSVFKPLVIGITWDSSWFGVAGGTALSYFNKARDADEIGAVWGSRLIREVIRPAIDGAGPRRIPLVLIGHSMGARLLGRATASDALQGSLDTVPPVDLLVGLEAAFSAARFVPGRGADGSPLADYPRHARRYVFTWSRADTANTVAVWSHFLGGRRGFDYACDCPQIFTLGSLNEHGTMTTTSSDPYRVALVDASSVIRHRSQDKGGNAHSDIYNKEIGTFLWGLIKDLPDHPGDAVPWTTPKVSPCRKPGTPQAACVSRAN